MEIADAVDQVRCKKRNTWASEKRTVERRSMESVWGKLRASEEGTGKHVVYSEGYQEKKGKAKQRMNKVRRSVYSCRKHGILTNGTGSERDTYECREQEPPDPVILPAQR